MEQSTGGRANEPGIEWHLRTFAALLRASPHNLLSARGLEELEERHLPESLAFSQSLPAGPRLLDIGSGGGLPGIVIAAARPDLEVHLLDATRKKTDFLVHAVTELGLTVTVHHGRAEELATGSLASAFDLVTARAVAPLDRLATWAAPFLNVGGQLHAIKGGRWSDELAEAELSLGRLGLAVRSTPAEAEAARVDGAPLVLVLERTR